MNPARYYPLNRKEKEWLNHARYLKKQRFLCREHLFTLMESNKPLRSEMMTGYRANEQNLRFLGEFQRGEEKFLLRWCQSKE
jgi:hypothetical protein